MKTQNSENCAQLDALRSDILKEIGNIGSGHVLTALASLTQKDFRLDVPEVEFLDYGELPSKIGDIEELRVAVALEVFGDIRGIFIFMAESRLAAALLEALGVGAPVADNHLAFDEMQSSALLEVGNIISNSYLTAIHELTGLSVATSIPALAVDMLGAVLGLPILYFAAEGTRTLYLHSAFCIQGESYSGNIILFPEVASMERLMEATAGL